MAVKIEPITRAKRLEELMNVKGIGEKSFLKLKSLVVVPAKTDKPAGQ